MQYTVSAIVPAYNEGKKISGVLSALSKSRCFNEILCVDDGSTDNTRQKIREAKGVTVITLKKNYGKAYAISKGIQRAKGDIVVFIDADISGLNRASLEKLIQPLFSGKYDASIGYRIHNTLDKLMRPLTGERAYFKKDLMPYINHMKDKGYGLELFLNYLFKDKNVYLFALKGVRNEYKQDKQPYGLAAKLYAVEFFDLLTEILKQKNPFSYLLRSYLYHYYFKMEKNKESKVLERLFNYASIKEFLAKTRKFTEENFLP